MADGAFTISYFTLFYFTFCLDLLWFEDALIFQLFCFTLQAQIETHIMLLQILQTGEINVDMRYLDLRYNFH